VPRNDKISWGYVGFPDFIIRRVDEVIEKDKYPAGRWHSRQDLMIAAVKLYLDVLDADRIRELEDFASKLMGKREARET